MSRYFRDLPLKPKNAGAGWPCTRDYWRGHANGTLSSDVCSRGSYGWGYLLIPWFNATGVSLGISGGWLPSRMIYTSGRFTPNGCNILTSCGVDNSYIFFAKSIYPVGVGIKIWDALEDGLWSSSVVFTIHRTCSFAGTWGKVQALARDTCVFPAKPLACPPDVQLDPVLYTTANACTDMSIPTDTLTVYDDGSFTVT